MVASSQVSSANLGIDYVSKTVVNYLGTYA